MISRRLILASASPRRENLLKQLGLDFTKIPSKVKEEEYQNIYPKQLVTRLASAKAEAVAELVENAVIIAADTVVVYNDEIMGKPENRKKAFTTLKKLNGNKHHVITGLAVLSTIQNEILIDWDLTEVFMRELQEEEISGYINSGEPFDKAGSYGIQGLGGSLIEKIHGSYFTVVGLPLHKLVMMLKKFSINVLKK